MNIFNRIKINIDMYSFVSCSANGKGDFYLRACLSIVATVHLVTQKVKVNIESACGISVTFFKQGG